MDYQTKGKKDDSITIRCTKKEKEQIYRKAKALNKSGNQYVIDCCMAGTERRSSKVKKMLIKEVQITEEINQIHYLFEKYKDVIPPECIDEMNIEISKLGEINKCQSY